MKKVFFCFPAAAYTVAALALNILLHTVTPLWYVWAALLWLAGFLLTKRKAWGGLFGLLPAAHILYLSTQSTGQVISEAPLGLLTAAYVLVCMFVVRKNSKTK